MTKKPLKVIHVHRQVLAANIKTGRRDPVVMARRKSGSGTVIRSNKIYILDDRGHIVAAVVCDIDRPLKCGARCYIETTNHIVNAENVHEQM